jgi:hypothetical protein
MIYDAEPGNGTIRQKYKSSSAVLFQLQGSLAYGGYRENAERGRERCVVGEEYSVEETIWKSVVHESWGGGTRRWKDLIRIGQGNEMNKYKRLERMRDAPDPMR